MNPTIGPTGTPSGINPTGKSYSGRMKKDIIPKGYREGRIAQFEPEQMKLYRQSIDQLSPDSYLSRLSRGDEDLFNEIEAPAFRDFNSEIGSIASRFSNRGTGSRRGSGFQNTTNNYASNFAQDLQSKRQGLMRQAMQDMMSYSQNLLGQRPYEKNLIQEQHKPEESSGWKNIAGGVLGGLGGAFFGMPVQGAIAGSAAANAF